MPIGDKTEGGGQLGGVDITPEQTLALFENRTLIDKIEPRLSSTPEPPLLSRLVELHNEGRLDLLSIVNWPEYQSLPGHDFFIVQHFLDLALPKLEATTQAMMGAVIKMVARGGNDGAANRPNGAFLTWINSRPVQALEVIDRALAGETLAIDHVSFALQSLHDRAKAREIALTASGRLRFGAVTALSRIPHESSAERDLTLDCFEKLLAGPADDEVCAMVLDAAIALHVVDKVEVSHRAVNVVGNAGRKGGETTLHRAAMALWTSRETMSDELVEVLLAGLEGVNPENGGILDFLDHGLGSLVRDGRGVASIAFVTKVLPKLQGKIPLSKLDGFGHALLGGDEKLFQDTVVSWLLSGSQILCRGIDDLLSRQDRARVLNIDFSEHALSDAQVVFLCRKAIGHFFMHPIVAGSILVSVLRSAPEALAADIENLLFDPLLVNYGGQLQDYLKSLAADDPAYNRVVSALAKAENYVEGLRSAGEIKELHPSEHQQQAERARITDQMAIAMKSARKQSVLLSMIKQSAILYGTRTVSFIDAPDGERRRIELEMKPHTVMHEWPRTETIDPIGLEEMLMVFRTEALQT